MANATIPESVSQAGAGSQFLYDEARLKSLFESLAATWRKETGHLSNPNRKFLHPAYQRIIGLGRQALPLILEDLKKRPSRHWFWALSAIVGDEAPLCEDTNGDLTACIDTWLVWAKGKGYL